MTPWHLHFARAWHLIARLAASRVVRCPHCYRSLNVWNRDPDPLEASCS